LVLIALLLAASSQENENVVVTRPAQALPTQRPATTQCLRDHRTDPKAGVLISEIVLEGPTASSSGELTAIKNQIAGSCFDEKIDFIGQMLQNAFSDHGFAQADVENVTLEASDSLALPKPVTLKAEVTEGPRFRMGEIKFVGNHTFSNAKLRATFPIKKGDTYQRSKVVGGLREVRKLYSPRGYADLALVPGIMFTSTGTTDLKIGIQEGPQYHMGDLRVYAKKEIADRMAVEWRLREGAIFNLDYPQTYIDKSRVIPFGFSRENVRLVRDCPHATITVMLVVDQTDPGLQNPPKDISCEKSKEDNE
jgi:outer membrane translocation and assembly module TamA